jgi:hypothetical protein
VDWSQAERVRLPNLKPSTKSISLRLPVSLLERIKVAAHKRDVPYQSLIKTWLAEKLDPSWTPPSTAFSARLRSQGGAWDARPSVAVGFGGAVAGASG